VSVFYFPTFLFGTLSSEDLDSMRRNVNVLAQNKQKITHVLQENLSILNVSRIEVAENRKSVNELLNAFAELHADFSNVTIVFNGTLRTYKILRYELGFSFRISCSKLFKD
jgi:hypothetical protein